MDLGSVAGVTGATGGLGLGLEALGLFGSIGSGQQQAQLESQAAGVSGQIAGYEEQINSWRQQQMNIYGQRQQIENLRNTQRVRAMGMAAAVSQGAQYGSGIAGAQSAATTQGAWNQSNITQDMAIGNTIFGLVGQIDQSKVQLANIEGQAATAAGQGAIWSGIGQLGGSLLGSSKALGGLFGNG